MKKDHQKQIPEQHQVDALMVLSLFLTTVFLIWAVIN